jgi:hypothetical protein
MPNRHQFTSQEAAQRRRAWLDGRHRWNRDLVLVLLRYTPEADIAHALDQLPLGACTTWPTCSLRPPTCTTSPTASPATSTSA